MENFGDLNTAGASSNLTPVNMYNSYTLTNEEVMDNCEASNVLTDISHRVPQPSMSSYTIIGQNPNHFNTSDDSETVESTSNWKQVSFLGLLNDPNINVEGDIINHRSQATLLTYVSQPSSSPLAVNEKKQDNESSNPEEAELRSLLSAWNHISLFEFFIDQKINVDILKIMKRWHIERLLKDFDMGTQISFEHKLEEWRESIGLTLGYQTTNNFSFSELSNPSSPASSCGSRAQTPTRFFPYEKDPDTNILSTVQLASILNETPRGRGLAEYYNTFSSFKEEQRNILITLVAQYFEEKGIKMSLGASHQMEKEILERFPSEKLEYYRNSKRGKLYTKFHNMTTSFKVVSKHIKEAKVKEDAKTKGKYRNENTLEPEINAESCIRALKFDNLTAEQFGSTWKACCHFRLNFIKEHDTAEIMEMWPFYKSPSGYRLIDMDFKTAFGKGEELLKGWERSFEMILSFLLIDNHVKDRTIRGLVETLNTNYKTIPEDNRNSALIWALHGFLVPTNKVVKKDASGRKSITKSTIRDSQESVLFVGVNQQEIEDRILHLKRTNLTMQPSIYCIGRDIFSIEEIFLLFDDMRYQFKSVLDPRALDICIKICYLFNLEFPPESLMFYSFIETYFFDFKSSSKYSKVHILVEHLLSQNNKN